MAAPHKPNLSVKEAAQMMGVTQQLLRIALQQGRFPFGTAVKMKRWAYYINSEMFYNYISGRKEVV
jgi:predicted DNA-binding protein (UPF0251 family)